MGFPGPSRPTHPLRSRLTGPQPGLSLTSYASECRLPSRCYQPMAHPLLLLSRAPVLASLFSIPVQPKLKSLFSRNLPLADLFPAFLAHKVSLYKKDIGSGTLATLGLGIEQKKGVMRPAATGGARMLWRGPDAHSCKTAAVAVYWPRGACS